MNISISHNKAILEIEACEKTAALRKYLNHIKHICEFLEKNYADYFNVETTLLADTDLNDP